MPDARTKVPDKKIKKVHINATNHIKMWSSHVGWI